MGPLKHTITNQILSNLCKTGKVSFQQTQIRKLSLKTDSSMAENVINNHLKSFTPFQQILDNRRDEANRSLIVQVKNRKSCDELLSYCMDFGPINKSLFYSLDHLHNYTIIEFRDRESTQAALSNVTHSTEDDVIPVTSSFLYFRITHQKESMHNGIPPVITERNTLPSKEELNQALSESGSFSDDMLILYQSLKLTDTGSRLRFLTAMQVEKAFEGIFSSCRVLPFGSSINSYGKMNCDLDLVLQLCKDEFGLGNSRLGFHSKIMPGLSKGTNQKHLEQIADILNCFLTGCTNVRRILRARVPIVKYKHQITGLDCDLSSTNLSGVYMSELLYILSSYDKRVCPLVFTIRYWAKELGITQKSPGKWITNFSLTLLVLFFLQHEKIIPTLDTLSRQKEPKDSKFIDEEDVGFLTDLRLVKDFGTAPNNDNLLLLLFKFFEFYSMYDFRSCAISLNSGTIIPKPVYDSLYIVNPLERGLNVSRNVSPEECERLRMEVRYASDIIEHSVNGKTDDSKWGFLHLIESRIRRNKSGIFVPAGMKCTTNFAVRNLVNGSFNDKDR